MAGFIQLALDFFSPALAPSPARLAPAPRSQAARPPANPSLSRHPLSHPRSNRDCLLAGTQVGYELQRVRRRSIGLVVGTDGLCVRAPRWVPQFEIDAVLQARATWILRRLEDAQARRGQLEAARVNWADGAQVPYLGEVLVVRVTQGEGDTRRRRARTWLDDSAQAPPTLNVALPPQAGADQLRDAVQRWLMQDAEARFRTRLEHFAPQLGVSWTRLRLSNAGTRWGSAQSDGTIRLNWRLIHFRQEVIDYVVVHELSHLRVMDHSPRFWDTVASVLPDFAERRQVLKAEVLPSWND